MRVRGPARGHECLRVAHGDRHVARKELLGVLEGRQRLVEVSGLGLRLAEGDVQQGERLVLLHERREHRRCLNRAVAGHQRQRLAVAVAEPGVAACELLGVSLREIHLSGPRQYAHPLADELIAARILALAGRKLRRPGALLGDAIGGHRVIDQHRRDVGDGESFVAAHGLEHLAHPIGIEAGAGEKADAHAVGFPFVVAREVDLLLGGDTLGGGDAALHRLPAADGAEQDRRQQRGRGGDALLLLVADHARDVMLRDVRGLVRHDARQLRFGRTGEHRSRVDEHEPAPEADTGLGQ